MGKTPSYETWKRIYEFNLRVAYPRMSEEKKRRILDKPENKKRFKEMKKKDK